MAVDLEVVYRSLLKAYGQQRWWPADTPEEVMIGAVLTQNTAWTNVEKAIRNLREANALDLAVISSMQTGRLGRLIRPSGYYNLKSRRLQALCRWVTGQGGYPALKYWHTGRLREALLAVYGVGPETADDILLYAFNRPVFVIDAYTRRLFTRLGVPAYRNYGTWQALFQSKLDNRAKLFSEYHALIIRHAKVHCGARPDCDGCVLRRQCRFGQANISIH